MFDFRPHSRFSAVGLPIAWAQSAVPVRTLVGEVLGARGNPLELLALVFSPISAVAIQPTLFTMQQIGQLLAVVHIGRSHAGTVHPPALAIYADVDLHAEVPLIAFLRLLHLRVALLLLVLGRRRRGDQRGIDNRPARQLHALRQEQLTHFAEQRRANLLLLQQVAKPQQRGGIGRAFAAQIKRGPVPWTGTI